MEYDDLISKSEIQYLKKIMRFKKAILENAQRNEFDYKIGLF